MGLLVVPAHGAGADDGVWQGFRGQAATADLPSSFGLVTAWERELGSGYSSLAVQGDRLVTLFTDGEEDVLAAFDRTTGQELWRLVLDEKYAGHDGSDDGPLASPAIDGDRVFALGPKGQLVAAHVTDGRELWRVQLDESNSTEPFYGYTASPLPVDDLVITLAGGPGRTVAAYDQASGELAWSTGDDSVTYQSPAVAELGGHHQVVAVSDFEVRGLDPKSGDELWSYRHTEEGRGGGSAHPTPVDDEHLLINLEGGAVMLQIRRDGDAWQVEEAWRGRPFGNALVLPVLHDGTLYGFTGSILSAVDPATGEFRWRSRDTGGAFNLSLVGDRLALVNREGHLVVAKAAPDAYTEVARAEIFERGDYADPAFMDGTFYVRNQTHMAALTIDENAASGTALAEAPDPHRYLGDFGAFVESLEKHSEGERQAAVDAHFAGIEHTPLTEDGGIAHIIYRGDAQEVLVQGTLFGWDGSEVKLHHVPGTDLHYRSLKLDPAGGYDYQLTVGFDAPGPDPANPLVEDAGFTRRSELRMPGFRANPHLGEPAAGSPRGTMDSFRFHSESLDNRREIKVWTPPGFSTDAEYPLLVVNHGLDAVRSGGLGNTLDHLVGQGMAPVVVAFVPRLVGSEYNGDQAPNYARFLVEELVPHLERHYGTGDHRAIMGPGSAGVISLHTAMVHPGTFDQVAVQSFYLTDSNRDAYMEMLDTSSATPRVRVETGPNDYVIPGAGIQAEQSSKKLVEALEAKGLSVDAHTVHGTAGWVGWRAQFDLILQDLFPLETEE